MGKVSFFPRVSRKVEREMSMEEVHQYLMDPPSITKRYTSQIRKLWKDKLIDKNAPNYQIAKKTYQRLKSENLACISPAATFSKSHKITDLEEYSSMVVLDYDDVKEIDSLYQKASNDPYVHLIHHSVGFHGFKPIIRISPVPKTDSHYKLAFAQVKEYFDNMLEISSDTGDDPTRLDYLGHDPDAIFHPHAKIFQWEEPSLEYPRVKMALQHILEHPEGDVHPDNYNTWLQIGMALKQGCLHDQLKDSEGESLWKFFSESSPKYDEFDQSRRWNSEDLVPRNEDDITLNSIFHFAKLLGFVPPSREKRKEYLDYLDLAIEEGFPEYLYPKPFEQSDVQRLFHYLKDKFIVSDEKVYGVRSTGTWIPIEDNDLSCSLIREYTLKSRTLAVEEIKDQIFELKSQYLIHFRHKAPDLFQHWVRVTKLFRIQAIQHPEIKKISEEHWDRYFEHQILPLVDKEGGISLKQGVPQNIEDKLVSPEDLQNLYIRHRSDWHITIPSISEDHPTVMKLINMCQKYRIRSLPRRMAVLLKGRRKAVDFFVRKRAGAGKSTIHEVIEEALKGAASLSTAKEILNETGQQWTKCNSLLSKHLIVMLDEAGHDKIDEISAGQLTESTSNLVLFADKYEKQQKKSRIGTLRFISGEFPNLNSQAQGVKDRLECIDYLEEDETPPMPFEEHQWLKSQEGIEAMKSLIFHEAWKISDNPSEMWDFDPKTHNFNSSESPQHYRISVFIDNTTPPEIFVLRKMYEEVASESSGVELREMFSHQELKHVKSHRDQKKLVSQAFPRSIQYRGRYLRLSPISARQESEESLEF